MIPTDLRLLILEDYPLDAELEVATIERAGYSCEWKRIQTREEFLSCLDTQNYDLILADYNLPNFDGLAALKLFQERNLEIPFIMVSGNPGEEIAIEALKAGATDYVLKNRIKRLGLVVERAFRDRDLKKRAAEAERTLRFSIDNAPEAVYWFTKEGGVRDVNELACRMLGYSREELLGFSLVDIDPKFSASRWREEWTKFEGDGVGTVQLETFHRHKDGSLIPVEVLATHNRFEHGELHVAFVRDISDRKEAEQERERLIEELGARNDEFAQKNAELERFTYTVSHDLKNPLVTIKGFSGMLQRDIENGDTKRITTDLEMIAKAADHMGRMLDELLELSRIGRVANPVDQVSLNQLAEEVLLITHSQLEEEGVKITLQEAMPDIRGDRMRLLEVYQNLIENAIKFKGSSIPLRIEIGAKEEEGNLLCWVNDNGIGIEPKYFDKIFGLFERLDLAREGTGIGLALVKRIVEFHGGRIWVESDGLDKGSTFYFTLPLKGGTVVES